MPYEAPEKNCKNGEVVPVRGSTYVVFFVTDGDVTHMRMDTHYTFDGTGSLMNVYHGSGQYSEVINVALPPTSETFRHRVRLTSSTAPDMYVHALLHITVNGNGVPTAKVEKAETNCDDPATF
jgi:hypothetical protein